MEENKPLRANRARVVEGVSTTGDVTSRQNDKAKSSKANVVQQADLPELKASPILDGLFTLSYYASAASIVVLSFAAFYKLPPIMEFWLVSGMPISFFTLAITAIIKSHDHKNAVQASHSRYYKSLEDLKSNPGDSNLREKTLRLGRIYAGLFNGNNLVTVYDETAIKNDIDTACAASQQAAPSTEKRLGKLKKLRDDGLIDDGEYRDRRRKIIDDV